jgi:hypothetical protein
MQSARYRSTGGALLKKDRRNETNGHKSGRFVMTFGRTVCRLLIVSLLFFSFHSVQAGMIGTDRVLATASAQADRAAVQSLLSRSEVSSQLQTLGIDVATARDRVAAMTDDEVRSLAGKLEALPAGASSNGWWIALIVVAAILLFYSWKR